MNYIIEFSKEIQNITIMIAPYLLIGFVASGILSVIISTESVAKYLGKNKKFSVFFASLFGIPLPLCSCGVIPVFSFLKKHGANKGAATSFLISTPQTGVDSIAVTWLGLGPLFAISRAGIAFISGIIGGTVVNGLDPDKDLNDDSNLCEETCCDSNRESTIYKILNYGFVKMPQDIGPSLIWGILIAALIGVIVPENFDMGYSTGIFGMLIMLVAGTPLYMCATVSVPIAVSLHHELGFTLGPLLVFLMAGPATNMVTINIARKHLGVKSSIIYLVSIIFCALFFGSLMEYSPVVSDYLKSGIPKPAQDEIYIDMNSNGIYDSGEEFTDANGDGKWTSKEECNHFTYIDYFYALVLVLIIANIYRIKFFGTKNKNIDVDQVSLETIIVKGMTCNHCVESIKKTIGKIKGVDNLSIDLSSGKVSFKNTGADIAFIQNEIKDLGFEVIEDV